MISEPSLPDKVVQLHEVLSASGIPHAFGGALALAYYAEPRATIDIDINIFLSPDHFTEIEHILHGLGADKFPTFETVLRYGQGRLWWGRTPVDLFFAYDPVHEAMRQAVREVPFGDGHIPVLAAEHLVVAKAVFNRPKDWIDIEQVLVATPGLDLFEARRWLDHIVGAGDHRLRHFDDIAARVLGPSD
ncbi:MAG: nucleotidyl transferase AbiEii/AbiGii toxin family protein [Acidimicrobiales bacterium]